MKTYEDVYAQARDDSQAFWSRAAESIHWDRPFTRVLDESHAPLYRWFTGGEMNTCYNAIDRHVQSGRGGQPAVIWESPMTGSKRILTFATLQTEVARFAGALRSLGIEKGDRVVIYMPMVPETLIAMYACARLGAIHSVVFGGFAAKELAVRIDDATPKLVLSASCGMEGRRIVPYKPLLDHALSLARHAPFHCVILQRDPQPCDLVAGRDLDWMEISAAAQPADCVPLAATDPLYILYTSGTTGVPKGIVRDNGGHAVALKWSMEHVYGVSPGEVFWAASDFGWAVGHSYMVYGPLLHGCTTVIYEGKPVGTPDPGEFWRIVAEHRVNVLFTAPTAFRAIKREDPRGEYFRRHSLPHFRSLFLAGERLDPDTYHWARELLGTPVIDNWWQTETGWPAAANCMGLEPLPFKAGSPTKPVPGYSIDVVDEQGNLQPASKEGLVVIRLPLPPGTLATLWGNEAGFRAIYLERFPGYYLTGDGGYFDADGYLYVMGRIDDLIIVSGHNLSTGSIEQALSSHPDVAECAVIGVKDALKTQLPVGLVVLKAGVRREYLDIRAELIALVREQVGPVANFRHVAVVQRLPKTRSGKVLRGTLRRIADTEPYEVPATIDDPAILGEIETALQELGYAGGA